MLKFILIALFIPVVGYSQQLLTYQTTDSVTYNCYLIGDWDKLIVYGNDALKQKVDYKNLRKRMGYAYYIKADYYSSAKHYEKALAFDSGDLDARAYLYFCGLNLGDKTLSAYNASKLPADIQKNLGISNFNAINAFDLEINKKTNKIINDSLYRSNPNYLRLGLNTKITNRLNLYQAISTYSQAINKNPVTLISTKIVYPNNPTKQLDYYALLNLSVNSVTSFDIGYHYINSVIDASAFNSNMFLTKINTRINRLQLAVNASIFKSDTAYLTYKDASKIKIDSVQALQFGLNIGYIFPGKAHFYVRSSLNAMQVKSKNLVIPYKFITTDTYAKKDTISQKLIFKQTIGAQIFKSFLIEGSLTIGDLKNYNDKNGLYVYNSLDATTFRTGLTLFYSINNKISLFSNYMFDKKKIENTITTTNYNQHSFTGGVLWQL